MQRAGRAGRDKPGKCLRRSLISCTKKSALHDWTCLFVRMYQPITLTKSYKPERITFIFLSSIALLPSLLSTLALEAAADMWSIKVPL
ncbi:unnamed protein product [Cylicocyclus nassatus]|uniref:Uncharacterized protein n=1 Tax=Cylicocyclus nassatus TaxID=53992 RepID=A0AA36DML0_CYLNA|nr:unnamed protein product [Cylicocyclus nassatus]